MESLRSGFLTETEMSDTKKQLYTENYKSNLKVFSDHNGFIKGELHTFIGTKGSGKSTWSKTIISELLYSGKRILLYLSEETIGKYLYSVNININRITKCEEKTKKLLDNLIVLSELDEKFSDPKETMKKIKQASELIEADLFLFDNFTTSFYSELPINQQSEYLRAFKELAKTMNLPVLMFFHTGKLYDKKRLDGDNVRGSATAINIGSYNYLITQVKFEGALRNFIYTEKARYHSRANKRMYEVSYEPRVEAFVSCKDYYIEDFNEMVSGGKINKNKKGWG